MTCRVVLAAKVNTSVKGGLDTALRCYQRLTCSTGKGKSEYFTAWKFMTDSSSNTVSIRRARVDI